MSSGSADRGRDAFVYLSRNPSKTARRISKLHASLSNAMPSIDFHIAGYDRAGQAKTSTLRIGAAEIPCTIYNLASALAIGYPAKVPGPWFNLIPGNCDIPILLFWREHPEYRRIWVIEDDVEYTGDFGNLVKTLSETNAGADLACTHLRVLPGNWANAHMFATGRDTLPENFAHRVCFLPFFCITDRALEAIDAAYRRGWAGHHEMTWPALLDLAGMRIRDIGGSGPFVAPEDRDQRYIDRSPGDFSKNGSFGTMNFRPFPGLRKNVLWHPVKPIPTWLFRRRKRFTSLLRWNLIRFGIVRDTEDSSG